MIGGCGQATGSDRVVGLVGNTPAEGPVPSSCLNADGKPVSGCLPTGNPREPLSPLPSPSGPPATGTLVHGIVQSHDGPFPPHHYDVTNFWQDVIDGQGYQVYAVAPYLDPAAEKPALGPAELIVFTRSTDPDRPDLKEVATSPPPEEESRLTLVDVRGGELSVQGASGAMYHFNVFTDTWQ